MHLRETEEATLTDEPEPKLYMAGRWERGGTMWLDEGALAEEGDLTVAEQTEHPVGPDEYYLEPVGPMFLCGREGLVAEWDRRGGWWVPLRQDEDQR